MEISILVVKDIFVKIHDSHNFCVFNISSFTVAAAVAVLLLEEPRLPRKRKKRRKKKKPTLAEEWICSEGMTVVTTKPIVLIEEKMNSILASVPHVIALYTSFEGFLVRLTCMFCLFETVRHLDSMLLR